MLWQMYNEPSDRCELTLWHFVVSLFQYSHTFAASEWKELYNFLVSCSITLPCIDLDEF